MSSENGRPWYKNPRIIIPAVVTILAAIVGATLTFWFNRPPPDFSISVNPMQGSVRPMGVIQTTVAVKGIHGYEHPVSLSASGQPSDIVVTFIPPIGGPTPAYASTVTINVASNVPADDYTIMIKGTGADGKEHTCTYTLTVKPPPATPTPTPTPSPTQTSTPTSTQPPTFTPTTTASPTSSPTVPPTYTPTNTPGPPPTPVSLLAEIFPQVGDGEAFVFINKGGILTEQYADTEECVHSGQYGLKLTYSMTGEGNGGWGVHWDKAPLGYFDASRLSAIEFWVIGAAGGETFQIGLKDTSEIEVKVESKPLVVVSASEWVKVRVDLGKFAGVNTASIRNVNVGFNRNHGAGSICIDDIAFVSP